MFLVQLRYNQLRYNPDAFLIPPDTALVQPSYVTRPAMNRLPSGQLSGRAAPACSSPGFASVISVITLVTLVTLAGCRGQQRGDESSVSVFNAGSLALPIRQALDSFAQGRGLSARQESAGSLETVRKITELGRVPDVVALADTALFSRLLAGRLAGPVAVLGTTRLVLAYTDRSRFAGEVDSENWPDVTTRPGVAVGRSDPELDPAGYRALMAMQLAERHYARPGLAHRLERAASAGNMRPKSSDLTALLQTGNLDYAWEYESVARSLGLRFISLPPAVNLGDPALAGTYALARVNVPVSGPAGAAVGAGGTRASFTLRGSPIVFGAAVPKDAPHPRAGQSFITYLMSPAGRSILAASGLAAARPSVQPTQRAITTDTR
jgi:molybdate/tungstate transport system substrate-binding protein